MGLEKYWFVGRVEKKFVYADFHFLGLFMDN
jgi:hypothetical protein